VVVEQAVLVPAAAAVQVVQAVSFSCCRISVP
jgi:hypothetical protein